jgi:ketosteroid isomerase-like protein
MTADAIRKAVQEGNRLFGAAVKNKDYAGLAALYTEKAQLLAPDAPIASGREAIKDFWTATATALGLQGATLKTLDLETSGDVAWEIGEALLALGSGQATVKYIVVWRKGADGSWRLHRDIWNAQPPQ